MSSGLFLATTQNLIFTKTNKLIKSNFSLNRNTSLWSNTNKLLKNHIRVLKQSWPCLVNLSLQGLYSQSLNTVRVRSVFKKVDTQSSSIDHSISALTVLRRLYEKCIYLCLFSILLKFKTFFKRQFGFEN